MVVRDRRSLFDNRQIKADHAEKAEEEETNGWGCVKDLGAAGEFSCSIAAGKEK